MTITISLILAVVLIAADQGIKYWVLTSLAPIGTMTVIPGVLNFTYVENYGAAFGILQGQRWLLLGITGAILVACVWLIATGRVKKNLDRLCTVLIFSGGVGNVIDRMVHGFVVDYIDINPLFSYPMFNLADCCVVAGCCLMILQILILEPRQAKKAAAAAADEANAPSEAGEEE